MQSKQRPNEKLKIGFVFDDSLDKNDGVAQYVKTLGKWLNGQGHEVRYLAGHTKLSSWHGGKVYSLSRNMKVAFNGNRLSTPLPANRRRIREIIAAEGFDVLHVQVPYSPLMAKRVINSAGKSTAIVGTFHILPAGRLSSTGTRLLRALYGRSLRRFGTMLSVSKGAAAFAKYSLGVASEILPNVVEHERFKNAGTPRRNGKNIVFLGRLVPRKGCFQLLQAFALLAERDPDYILTVAGDGPERARLESFVRRKGLSDRVKFLGFIPEKVKPALLANADVACFPAMYGESFGIVLIEAMAARAGVVIGGNNPGYASVLDKETLFNPKDAKGLAALMDSLLKDEQKASRIHEKQQEQVKSYDVETVGPQLVDIYHREVAKLNKRSHN